MTLQARRVLAALLMAHAAARLRGRRREWADAMANEDGALQSDAERLAWAAGCALASYRAPGAWRLGLYPPALGLGVALAAAYQWSADESLKTVGLLGLISLGLGLIAPGRAWLSGAAVGLVVAGVNGFETLTGLRPAYETAAHSLMHDAAWSVLAAPALTASQIGGALGRRLRPERGAAG